MSRTAATRASIPTQILDEYWLWAKAPSKDILGGPRTGKWMLFYDKSVLDEKWATVKQLVEQDMLGGLAKCSTAKENPNATSSKSGVIIVYTSDYQDQEEVYRIAVILHEKLEYNRTMYYKTDEQTHAGAYRKYGSQKNHIYSYPL
ncbi:MAG: translation initiation factor eIF 4e-like domain-containing protein [Linnemannia gamsii]|nr:MAG: translation initiation factor eIF 4e-like domain-containing protein [Linnemannia gamsii]